MNQPAAAAAACGSEAGIGKPDARLLDSRAEAVTEPILLAPISNQSRTCWRIPSRARHCATSATRISGCERSRRRGPKIVMHVKRQRPQNGSSERAW